MTASRHHSLPELARAAGLSESTCRRYARTFSDFLRYEDKGRIRLYRPECVQVLQRIRELYDQGNDSDAVHDVLAQEFSRTIEQDPGADSGGGPPPMYQQPAAGDIAHELINAIQRNAQTDQEIHNLKRAVKILRDHVVQIRNERKALPDPRTIDQVLARLDQIEKAVRRLDKRVEALEDGRLKPWWRKLTGKKDGSEG